MSLAKLALAASRVNDLPLSKPVPLPPRHLAAPLCQYYLDHFLVFYPFLPETKIFGSVQSLYMGHGDAADHWTVFLILAISLASMSTSPNDDRYEEATRYLATAVRHAEETVRPGSIQAVQMVFLLAQYALVDPYHFDVWYTFGFAARIAVDLGLHQDRAQSERSRDFDEDLRRRIFYSVYAFDRIVSMSYRRAFSFTDDSVNVSKSMIQRTDMAKYLLSLREIQSLHYQKLFQSGPSVMQDPWPTMCVALQDLRQWEDLLPLFLLQSAIGKHFHSEILYTNILLLSPPGTAKTLDYCYQLLLLQYMIDYADTLSWITHDPPASTFCTWNNALQVLFVADRFFVLLQDFAMLLFNVSDAKPSTVPQGIRIPGVWTETARERLDSSFRALHLLEKIVDHFGTKFGYSMPFENYRLGFIDAVSILQQHRD